MKTRIFLLVLLLLSGGVAGAQGNKDILKVAIREAPAVDKMAIVIGVDDYLNAGKLSACGKDARAFAQFLQTQWGFTPANILLMTDNSADPRRRTDRNSLNRALRNFTEGVDEHSEVVVFFSGHGLRDSEQDYLAPSDADIDDIKGTCISYNELRNQLEGRNPRRCLLITDACRNIPGKSVGRDFGKSAFSDGPQFAELRSCRPGERSQEMPDGTMGVFTNFLIKGLQGEAGVFAPDQQTVTFDALKRYVSGQTRSFVLDKLNERQNPDGRASYGDMVLSKWDGLAPVASVVPLPSKPVILAEEANTNLRMAWGQLTNDTEKDSVLWPAVSKALLKGATNFDLKIGRGDSPLHMAACYDDVPAIQFLLAKGADVNIKNISGYTPLHVAAWRNADKAAEFLIGRGANVNAPTIDKGTPLHEAAFCNADKVMRLLLANGADINAKTKWSVTPLSFAAFRAYKATELLLAKGADVNAKDVNGSTPLHTAANTSQEKIVALLLASGAEVNAKTNDGDTPLHYTVVLNLEKIVTLLLAKGADVNARNNNGDTPLKNAKQRNATEVIPLLIKAGGTE